MVSRQISRGHLLSAMDTRWRETCPPLQMMRPMDSVDIGSCPKTSDGCTRRWLHLAVGIRALYIGIFIRVTLPSPAARIHAYCVPHARCILFSFHVAYLHRSEPRSARIVQTAPALTCSEQEQPRRVKRQIIGLSQRLPRGTPRV